MVRSSIAALWVACAVTLVVSAMLLAGRNAPLRALVESLL